MRSKINFENKIIRKWDEFKSYVQNRSKTPETKVTVKLKISETLLDEPNRLQCHKGTQGRSPQTEYPVLSEGVQPGKP